MAQASSHLSASSLSVEQTASAINGMIAERAAERLRGEPVHKNGATVNTVSAAKPREPGIYFGLPMDEYHRDPSLGSTNLKALLVHPACYWARSHMNPDRIDDSDSPAKKIGRALHALVLEGEAAFAKQFAGEPSPEGYPGALVSLEDLKAKCRELGEPVSGTKAELAKRIKAKDSTAIIFDDVLALFRAMTDRRLSVADPRYQLPRLLEALTTHRLRQAWLGDAARRQGEPDRTGLAGRQGGAER